jgi:hypothetical protein
VAFFVLAAVVQVSTGQPLIASGPAMVAAVLCLGLVFYSKPHSALELDDGEGRRLRLRTAEPTEKSPAARE